jgi:tripartite-type tricarboxylate transporter receptor subunit TctC
MAVPRQAIPRASLHFLRRRRLVTASLAVAARPAGAQAPWPQQPVRILVGFSAGGGLDLAARLLARSLTSALGQQVQVENRTGANGALANDGAARATDGHTLVFGNTGSLAINNALFPGLATDPLRDLAPVAVLVETPFFFAVSRRLDAETLPAFIAAARARPGALSFGSNGIGSLHHLAFERFRRALGLDIVHVPYRGMSLALQDLAAGRLDFAMDAYPTMRGAEEAGEARLVGVTTAERVAWRAELPTVAEAARLPGYEVTAWMALMAPRSMAPQVVQQIEAAVAQALRDGALAGALQRLGLPARFRDGAATRAMIEAERAGYATLIREAGIRPDGS